MRRSYFFHRDPADAFYTDRDEPEPAVDWSGAYCPFCDGELAGQPDGRAICNDCECTFDDEAEVIRLRSEIAAAPFYGN